jgi:condensin complex subunit 3
MDDREAEHEFIVRQLVGMAVNLDYGDEIGRRKMFELMRE